MNKITSKVAMITSVLTLAFCGTAFGATLDSVNKENWPGDELTQYYNNDADFQALPQEVIGLYNDLGGKIVYKPFIEAKGPGIVMGTYTVDSKEIAVREGTTPYDLVHEFAHFIYFNTDISPYTETIKGYYNRLLPGIIDDNFNVEEAFAKCYVAYVCDGSYFLNDAERQMCCDLEEQVKDKYYANHPDEVANRAPKQLRKRALGESPSEYYARIAAEEAAAAQK